jgi:hypothetical protein
MTSTSDHINEPFTTATQIANHKKGILFEDPKCDITFEYPANWSIIPIINSDNDTRCAFGINPPDYSKTVETSDIELAEYAVIIGAANVGFYEGASEMGFGLDKNGWFVYGRQLSKSPAILVKDGDRYILRGSNYFGTFRKFGGYAGLAQMDRAVIYITGNTSAFVYDTISTYRDCFEYVLQTIII